MISSDLVLGILFISQTGIGFLGNCLLFVLYMYTFLIHPNKKKPIDVILTHLTLSNAMTLVFRGIPNILLAFGIKIFMDDICCKTVLYIQRVTRGLSVCTTSLLSTFQAVTITPSNYRWAWLKLKISTCTLPSLLFLWIINMLIYIEVILRAVSNSNTTQSGPGYNTPFCKIEQFKEKSAAAFLSAVLIRDLFFLFLMTFNSIYMVSLLFRHHKNVHHVHSTTRSPQSSPENKATHVILLLVSCYVFFYWTNSFLTIYLFYVNEKKRKLELFSDFISSCYPTFCPFLLIKNENRFSKPTCT
ncbi:vomeronasal type-1 receptor 3-like [Choloepus didactylus]|uniref:vomeronasal type-1 receptor 3-like n=1 Tax=Choloepus didactylus TaxID=27675 RepID=UPI00189CE859|nr:vomeronasal type-1 receptor 3-like [Choloepus didactylus]